MTIKGVAFIGAIEPNKADIAVGFVGDTIIAAVVITFLGHNFYPFKFIIIIYFACKIAALCSFGLVSI